MTVRQQIKAAPKYMLYSNDFGFLAAEQNLNGVLFTQDKESARQFAVGFDNPNIKLGIWNAEAKKLNTKFEIYGL